MIETARKEDLFLDKKLIIPENRLDAIRIMARLHPVVGDQPTNEKDQPNTNNPVLDLACTILNIHESGIGVHADLRKIQNEPPKYFYGKGFMSGISSLKGNGILAVYGQWHDASGRYAIKQFYYTDKEILWRNAISDTAWSAWFDVLTGNSSLDYNKLLNVPITSTLSDSKTQIASIFTVNEVNRKAVTAQKTANEADAKAVAAMNEALKKMAPGDFGLGSKSLDQPDINDMPRGIYFASDDITPPGIQRNIVIGGQAGIAGGYIYIGRRGELLIRGRHNVWDEYVTAYSTLNTSNIKGFLRASGNLIPLTEDQITSALSDSKINPASIFIVNEVNRAAVIAQQSANNANEKANKAQQDATKGINDAAAADKKAVNAQTTANTGITNAKTAQERADAAFSRIKPIAEGGTGATNAANARKNLGISDTKNTASKKENGWWKCADTGIMHQWGTFLGNKATFPHPFENGALSIIVTANQNRSVPMYDSELTVSNKTKTGFTTFGIDNYNKQFFAIGY